MVWGVCERGVESFMLLLLLLLVVVLDRMLSRSTPLRKVRMKGADHEVSGATPLYHSILCPPRAVVAHTV